MAYDFPENPENWKTIKEAMFMTYGGKYCRKGLFRYRTKPLINIFGLKYIVHEGYVDVHHYVSLSKAKYESEYYFLNQQWNLVPLCEKHHKKVGKHNHMRVKGYYNPEHRSKSKKVGYLRQFGWKIKRGWYKRKFDKRKNTEKILRFWYYWGYGEKKLKDKMYSWPKKYLEDLV